MDGNGAVLKKLVVDVGNGVVQDVVLHSHEIDANGVASATEAQMHMLMRM